jgi:hypothetical protein
MAGEWLETKAKIAVDRLIHEPSAITYIDTAYLLVYIELQRIRVPRQGEVAKRLMHKILTQNIPPELIDAFRAGEFVLTIKDSARFEYMRMLTGQLHPWFGTMEWEIFEAGDGSAFITTDSPVSFYNADVPPPAEAGIGLAGTFVFFPLSSRYALLMRHPKFREDPTISRLTILPDPPTEDGQIVVKLGKVWDKGVVDNFNWKMMKLSDHLVVAESKEILEACIAHHAPEGV